MECQFKNVREWVELRQKLEVCGYEGGGKGGKGGGAGGRGQGARGREGGSKF